MAQETGQRDGQTGLEDAQDELQELVRLARVYGLPIVLGLAIAVAIISVIGLYHRKAQLTADAASTVYSKAMQMQDVEARVRQLDDVVTRYPSTPAAPSALMALAKARYDEGQADIAMSKYIEFKTAYPEHPYAVGAELGRLHCLEALDSRAEALTGFELFLKEYGDHYLAPQATLGKARCMLSLGQTNEAREVCEELMVARPDTAWSAKAEMLIGWSKRKRKPVMQFAVPPSMDLYGSGMGSVDMPPISLAPPPVAPPAAEVPEVPAAEMPEEPAAVEASGVVPK